MFKRKKYLVVKLKEGKKHSKARCELFVGNSINFEILDEKIKFEIMEVNSSEIVVSSSKDLCNSDGGMINMLNIIRTLEIPFNETKYFSLPILDYPIIFKMEIK